jgi:hypothetical protein
MDRRGPAIGGCAGWLAQWAALAALGYLALRGRVAPPGDWIAALVGSLSLRLALGAFASAARSAEDRRVLARSRAGALPQDGKRFAAAGRIAALAAPLAAPFSGTPAVAYRYRAGGAARDGEAAPGSPPGYQAAGSAPALAGFALAPAAIRASAGDVRLLGFPLLEGFPETIVDDDAARARAAAFVGSTPFEGLGPADWARVFGEALALAADVQGSLRKDFRVGGLQEVASGDRLAETVVPDGEEAVAIGLFHAAEGGVAPDPSPAGRPLRLLRGDAASAAAALARAGRREALAGLALLVIPPALLAAFVLLRR